MQKYVVVGLYVLFGSVGVWAASHADTAYVPPTPVRGENAAGWSALSLESVRRALEAADTPHRFDAFEGTNATLRAAHEQDKVRYVADGYAVDLTADELFHGSYADGTQTAWVAAISSVDALALRIRVDLSQLNDTDEVYVIDPSTERAYGPYVNTDQTEDGLWLATTIGDHCVLAVYTAEPSPPDVSVLALSHFYQDLNELAKALSCNIHIECESSVAIQESSTAVGMLIIPQGNFFQALCTGALINNADTPDFEPYLLTSWHCVPDAANPNEVEVIWDWRADTCNGSGVPTIGTLPRSDGERLLRSNSSYDITLMELDSVPNGDFGRAYLGWDTRDPIVAESVVTIHFAGGSPMRISYGDVLSIDQNSNGFIRQTKVHWDDGVTEGGSSGGPLLLAAENYRICGTLSNGPVHSCTSNTGNVDWFSSFRDFFPSIEGYLTGDDPPDPGPTPGPGTGCAASKAFPDSPEVLDGLRAFRDHALKTSRLGSSLVDAYYLSAPTTAQWVEESPVVRAAIRGVSKPIAFIGTTLWGSGDTAETR